MLKQEGKFEKYPINAKVLHYEQNTNSNSNNYKFNQPETFSGKVSYMNKESQNSQNINLFDIE